jgi:putative phage-type endonuclease
MELLSYIENPDIKRNRKKVKALQKKPQPEQRTPAWFEARNTRITASEAASCLFKSKSVCEAYVKEFNLTNFKYKETESLNPYESREDYIIKKCASYNGENVFKDSIFTLWGKKYEEVANRLYCKLNNTKVIEFGLISHSRLKWLAASPDGITPDGVMLEIKCPKARKIDENQPPLYYWIQTQIQMETVDLDLCDFFECEIEEFSSEQQFIDQTLKEKQDKGIVLQINDSGPDPKFVYPPIELNSTEDYINWKNENMNNSVDVTYTPIYYFIT